MNTSTDIDIRQTSEALEPDAVDTGTADRVSPASETEREPTIGESTGETTEPAEALNSGRYVYAVCRDLDPALLADVPSLGGPLHTVQHRGLTAVVSTVDLDEFGESGLRTHLEDLQWLENTARTHDAVIQAVATAAPTAPLRLATICLTDDGVRQRLDEWHDQLQQVLERISGRSEWSVKILTSPVSQPKITEEPVTSGAAYLRRKKSQTEAKLAGDNAAREQAESIHAALREMSVASRRLPPQDPRLTGHQGTMLLNGAYLIEDDHAEEFEQQLDRLAETRPELIIDRRGPWPPYSFATLEQS